ncbi:TPA: hypothetical protein NID53_002701 [Pseudomonas aeruginosa]|nr:hypothetical protein [Pseudomonas aeruginosa]HEQ0164205.1 hypothetical protein [Pseudomonas aeruginosa]
MEQAMRDEFEAWWRSAEVLKSKRAVAFDAWQSSRAALRVELPEPYAFHQEVQTVFLDRVKEALQQAGIEVKHG